MYWFKQNRGKNKQKSVRECSLILADLLHLLYNVHDPENGANHHDRLNDGANQENHSAVFIFLLVDLRKSDIGLEITVRA